MIDIKKLLLKKYKSGSLGQLYILRTSYEDSDINDFLKKWAFSFIEDALSLSQKVILNHPDILYIQNTNDENYKLKDDSINSFFRFIALRPFELPHRFIVIDKAHLISERLSNKFLISFESPPPNTTIIILDPLGKKLLPTIQSRSITINIKTIDDVHGDDDLDLNFRDFFLTQLKKSELDTKKLSSLFQEELPTISLCLQVLKTDKPLAQQVILIIIDYERLLGKSFLDKEKLLKNLEWFTQVQIYSNGASEVLTSILAPYLKPKNSALQMDI